MATRIKHVKGNVLRLQIPLTIKRVSMDEGSVVEVEEDFFPSPLYPVYINFKSTLKRAFEGMIDGNVVSMRDQGTLNVGTYQIEVLCNDDDGNPYRYMVRDIIEVVDATADAGIVAGVEFDSETYTLEGAVFIGFAQEQTDWAEQDDTKVSYLKNKPTFAQVAFSGDFGDLQNTPAVPERLSELMDDELHRTVTDAEKTEWNAKQEAIADLGDIRAGAAAGATALQSESDPTVPAWAKQPTKPSYNYSEIGNTPDLSGFITKSVDDLVNYYLKSETYTRSEVEALIAAINQFAYEVVQELPTASAATMYKIYLVPSADPQTQNVKDEYITVDNGASASTRYTWEQIGSTAIDLSGYVTTQDLDTALADYTTTVDLTTLLATKQDTITDLATIRTGAAAGATAYQKPSTGIPSTDLASAVQTSLGKADTALQSESDPVFAASAAAGITASDITAWDGKYMKPSTGIPATDLAAGVIPDISGKADKATTLAGYGITDAKIESGTITLGANTITPLTQHQDISGKADKVTGATSGNFAALDSNGNLTDSGHKHGDYLTQHQAVTDGDPTLAWNTRSKVATIGSTDIHVTMPANPNPVPAPAAADNGKVLSVTDAQGTIGWTTPTGGGGDVTDVTLGGSSVVDGNGVAVLPAYPTTLPASDVYSWAKAATKPAYDYSEIANTPAIPELTDYTDAELQTAIDTAFANL